MRFSPWVLVILSALCLPVWAQESFKGCGMEGDARAANVRALNRLKNRYTEPPSINPGITLEAILAPGDDRTRWKTRDGA